MKINAHTRLLQANLDNASKIATVLCADGALPMGKEEMQEFSALVREALLPGVKAAQQQLEHATTYAATKIRSWALIHIRQAKILGKNPAMFEKLLNDPRRAARQLALHLMGIPKKVEDPKLSELFL